MAKKKDPPPQPAAKRRHDPAKTEANRQRRIAKAARLAAEAAQKKLVHARDIRRAAEQKLLRERQEQAMRDQIAYIEACHNGEIINHITPENVRLSVPKDREIAHLIVHKH